MRFEPLVDLPERPAPDALAFAFSGDRLLTDVARDIIARRLRLK